LLAAELLLLRNSCSFNQIFKCA